jgi:hypothetical protein
MVAPGYVRKETYAKCPGADFSNPEKPSRKTGTSREFSKITPAPGLNNPGCRLIFAGTIHPLHICSPGLGYGVFKRKEEFTTSSTTRTSEITSSGLNLDPRLLGIFLKRLRMGWVDKKLMRLMAASRR